MPVAENGVKEYEVAPAAKPATTTMPAEENGKEEAEVAPPAKFLQPKPQVPTAPAEENGRKVVQVAKTNRVLPRKLPADARPTIPLVTFDLPYITFYYNQKLLVYKWETATGGEFEEAVERLKEGLSLALEPFYPLAGTLGKDEEGVLRVEIDGERVQGVEVVEAVAEGVTSADLAEGDAPAFLEEIVPYAGVMNLEGLSRPLLAVQFTKLKDGIAIGCAFNHAILDGQSTWHFMGSWAELCRSGGSDATPTSALPFHDRSKARITRVKLDLPESPAAHEAADPAIAGGNKPKLLREKIFSFPAPAVERIKSDTNSSAATPNDDGPLSTFQCLGAHVWRAVCRARHLNPEDYTVFAVFADCRRRLSPPLPETYFGNAIQAVFTVTASGLLLASPPGVGAAQIRQAIRAHGPAEIDRRSSEWEAAPKVFHYRDAGINCVAVGSSPRFRVYDVDFGFGRPERVRSGGNNKFDGMMYLYQGRDGEKGSIDVELTLDVDAMGNLVKDEEFLKPVAANGA